MNLASVTQKLRNLGFTGGKLGKDDFDSARALAAYSLIDKDGNVVLDADNLAATLASLISLTPPKQLAMVADLLLSDPSAPDTAAKALKLMSPEAVADPQVTPWALQTISKQLHGVLSGQFGIRLQSTGDAADDEMTRVIMQTVGVSPKNPCVVNFEQIINDPFTGAGQFDLVERDSRRRSVGGASAGGTPVLTDPSGVMNWQSGDADKLLRVGTNPGRVYKIVSRQSTTQVTLNANITLPSSGLTLTMDGSDDSEVTIATRDGFTDVDASSLTKVLDSDKVYSVVFVPGDAGDGAYSIIVKGLNGGK